MAALLLDTGVLLSLAADRTYASAAKTNWAGRQLWVPTSVKDELRWQVANARPDIPPELPGHALGIIASDAWNIETKVTSDDEDEEIRKLQERIGGSGSTAHAGECEAAVLITHRDPAGVLATDDPSALPVLARYVVGNTGIALQYVHTSTIIDELTDAGHIDERQRDAIVRRLRRKGRPLL